MKLVITVGMLHVILMSFCYLMHHSGHVRTVQPQGVIGNMKLLTSLD